jgi:hypothetical protein
MSVQFESTKLTFRLALNLSDAPLTLRSLGHRNRPFYIQRRRSSKKVIKMRKMSLFDG